MKYLKNVKAENVKNNPRERDNRNAITAQVEIKADTRYKCRRKGKLCQIKGEMISRQSVKSLLVNCVWANTKGHIDSHCDVLKAQPLKYLFVEK